MSLIWVSLIAGDRGSSSVVRTGRHLRTLSTLARQGWHIRGNENKIRITIDARPIVDVTDGGSENKLLIRRVIMAEKSVVLTHGNNIAVNI